MTYVFWAQKSVPNVHQTCVQRQDTEREQGDSKSCLLESKTVSWRGTRVNWVLWLSISDGLSSAKGIRGEAKQEREPNERERPGAPRTHQAMGSSQSAHCRLQGQSRRAPVGSLRTSGPQATHQQRGVAVGPHPWGLRGLAQARLQVVGVGNPGWVLCCLSTHTHTQTSATCRPGPTFASEHNQD